MKRNCDDDSDEIPGGSDSDQETEESWIEEDGSSSPVLHNRKRRRGMVEKMRRDRINNCLAELKYLVPAAMSQERRGGSKLEKAEVLELTVEYVRNLIRRDAYPVIFPDDDANLSPPSYSHVSKANLSYDREPHHPRDRCVNLDCMAGFSECAHQITAHLASLTAVQPELKGIQTTLLTHIQHVFKRNFLDHNGRPAHVPSGEHSAHTHRSKPSFEENPNILPSEESEGFRKINTSKESGKTLPDFSQSMTKTAAKKPEDSRLPLDITEGFRPYNKTSDHPVAAQKESLDGRKRPHDEDRQTTSGTCEGFPELFEQLRRRLGATSCSNAQKRSRPAPYEQATSTIYTDTSVNHSFAHRVMQTKLPNVDLQSHGTNRAVPGFFKSTTAKHKEYQLNDWQNLRQVRMRKPSVPHPTQHAVGPAWFILPSLRQSALSLSAESPWPAAVRDIVPLQMALSLPSPLVFDSTLHQPGRLWSLGIN